MTKKIAWITDTASFVSKEFCEANNVHLLPLIMVFEDGSFRETVDMTHTEFYKKLREAKVHPKTSQPSFGEHVALYEKLKEEGYDCAIAVHTSGQQSGTVTSAPMAAEQAGFKTYAIDAKIGSYPMQKMLELGMELDKEGLEVEEIVAQIEAMVTRSQLAFLPASLEQLHKSGRVSGMAMFMSNLLNIKLVIAYNRVGICEVVHKVRAEKRAKKAITDLLDKALEESSVDEVAVINCNNLVGANEWIAELQQSYPAIKFIPTELSAAVGVHAGEGTLGLTWVRNR